MSGVGKSHWARRLATDGMVHLDCDAEIAERLAELVTARAGESPVHAVGRWMGMPSDPGYAEREAAYLVLEEEVTQALLQRALEAPSPAAQVLDTTGSVVHLSPRLLQALQRDTFVVYLATAPETQHLLVERFLQAPKPVVWGDCFAATVEPASETASEPASAPASEQDAAAAVAQAYPALLKKRDQSYRSIAHHTLEAQQLSGGPGAKPFLSRICPPA